MSGLWPGLTYAEYESLPGVRASQLQGYARSPLHARHERQHPSDSRQFALGRALHAAVLEPELYNTVYVAPQRVSGAGSRGLNKALAQQARERGEIELSTADRALVEGMRSAIINHPVSWQLLADAMARELTVTWTEPETGAECKARLDLVTRYDEVDVAVCDIKTCRDAAPRAFARDAISFGYHRAAAWYVDGLEAVEPSTGHRRWLWIAVESEPPHGVAVYECAMELLEIGREDCERFLRRHVECERAGQWPGYEPEVLEISPPRWMEGGWR